MKRYATRSDFFLSIDTIYTPVVIAKGDELIQINTAFKNEIGYSLEDIPTRDSWFERAFPNDKYRSIVLNEWQSRNRVAVENNFLNIHLQAQIRCADNTFRWYDVHEAFEDDYRIITLIHVSGIREANKQLSLLLKQRNHLLATITDEIRGPQTTILQLLNNSKIFSLSWNSLLQILSLLELRSNNFLNKIAASLIDTDNVEERYVANEEEIDFKNILSQCRHNLEHRLKEKEISLTIICPEPAMIIYDSFVLDLILQNVSDYMINHTQNRGSITMSFFQEEDSAKLVVTSLGFVLFDPWLKGVLESEGIIGIKTCEEDGSGAELDTVKKLLEINNDKLVVLNNCEKETSFEIWFNC